ncbi:hypothetical protein [Alkalimonas amylolytica]|uniref:Uncharacterized protein n=1 Tax=Alkalimonas amylolytica TaxID=152573 RepID=A0A1H4D697_ALKAM|nr:hypothetical protein [Alkalimonas amylolytica]SEA68010.1 hypothetical protein SAMN04488051_10584 [Alkalimonas amylolytica]
MDILTLINISAELGTIVTSSLETASNTQVVTTTEPAASGPCYRQGSFSFGNCSMSEAATSAGATSFSWLWLNVLFAMMLLRRDIHRFWKVATFLFGLPGTVLIAGFLWLMRRSRAATDSGR